MKKFYQKLGNIPCLIIFGVLAIIGVVINEVSTLFLAEDTSALAYYIALIALYAALMIVSVMKNKIAVLGIFTITLGAFGYDCLVGGIDQLISLKDIFANDASYATAYGVSTLMTGICNMLVVVAIVFYFVAKFVLKEHKTAIIETIFYCFTIAMILFVVAVIICIAGGVFDASGSDILTGINVSYEVCELVTFFFILTAGTLSESVSKKEE